MQKHRLSIQVSDRTRARLEGLKAFYQQETEVAHSTSDAIARAIADTWERIDQLDLEDELNRPR